ncbi:enoyl-CoA hydratase/isomerase family protein [Salinigranum sp. GCM10025319]|uniref:enoyl-CoA hydratase/isomerase family protein n=1 Tax=Salinigranum sp. GCM10025319 TaxID=3252687 RepID=UPI003615D21D
MSYEYIDIDIDDRVATISFDRPEHDNKIIAAMMQQYIEALEEATASGADLLVLRGTGGDFTVGRDQDENPEDLTKEDNLSMIFRANGLLTEFDGVSIAAVRGRALGFGCGTAAQSDITIAGSNAVFGFDEINHGFAPTIVLTWLETYVGRKAAIDLVMTGRRVPASEAKEMGLVTQVVPDERFEAVVEDTIDDTLGKNIEALKTCKFYPREIQSVDQADRADYALSKLLD